MRYGYIPFFFMFSCLAMGADSYLVTNGTPVNIDEHGVCKQVTNENSGTTIMVPTKYSTEWASFRSGPPAYVTLADCPAVLLTWSGSSHTESDCEGEGGVVYDTGANGTICRLSLSACPSGWTKASNWSSTAVGSLEVSHSGDACGDYTRDPCKGYIPDPVNIPAASTTLTTGSHSWSNTAVETNSCVVPNSCLSSRSSLCGDESYTFLDKYADSAANICGVGLVNTRKSVRITDGFTVSNGASHRPFSLSTKEVFADITEIGCY